MRKNISTNQAPAAIGPYNQAVQYGKMIYVSGSLPVNPSTGEVVAGGIVEQTKQSLTNIKSIVEAAGSNMDQVVKTTVFMQDLTEFTLMNDVYTTFFTKDNEPARSTVQVAKLPKNVLVEIECVAFVDINK